MCIFSFLFSEAFWVFITASATIGLAIIAQNQLTKNNNIAAATFLNDFKNSFFTEQQRVFITLIENKWLIFDGNDIGIFKNETPLDFKNKFKQNEFLNRDFYLTQEVDDFLIGHFEDAALLEKNGIIKEKDADQNFGYYLNLIYEDEQMQQYINWAKNYDPDVYSNMISLYKKLNHID